MTIYLELLIPLALFLLGCVIVVSILQHFDGLALLSLGLGVGAGVLTYSLFLVSWVSVPVTASTVLILASLIAIIAGFLAWRRWDPQSGDVENTSPSSTPAQIWLGRFFWLIIALLILGSAYLAAGLAYYSWDGIAIWSVKGYAIARAGSIFGAGDRGLIGLAFPLNIPLQITAFRLFTGDILPGSKLLFPAYSLMLLVGVYRFWIRRGVQGWLAALGALLMATTPLIFTHATIGYTNTPLTFYLLLGVLWVIEGVEEEKTSSLLLGGLLMALAVWTRPEGLILWLAAFLGLTIAALRFRASLRRWLYVVAPFLAIAVPWLLFLGTNYQEVGEYAASRGAVDGILRGEIYPTALFRIFRFLAGQVVRYREYGFLLFVSAVLFVIAVRPRVLFRDFTRLALLFCTVMLGAAVVGILYVFAYPPFGIDEVIERLGSDFSRVFLPAALTFTTLAMILFSDFLVKTKFSETAEDQTSLTNVAG